MSTAVLTAYQPPSREELVREIRLYAPAMYLYHACPEWLTMEIFARAFSIPPHLEGEPMVEHPFKRLQDKEGNDIGPVKVKADGKLAVRDIYGIIRNPRMRNMPIGTGLLEGQDAGAIVMFAVENFSMRGVVWLRGDASDESRMKASAKLYSRFIRGWAEGERQARAAFVAKWQARPENKGREGLMPPPNGNQIRAQEILDTLAVEARSGSEFICTACYGWEGSAFEKYARHMKAAHGRTIQPPEDETRDPKRRARPLSHEEVDQLVNPPDATPKGTDTAPAIAGAARKSRKGN